MSSASPPLIPKPETRYRNESGAVKERPLLDMMEPVDDAIFHNWYKISVSGASRRRSEASLTRERRAINIVVRYALCGKEASPPGESVP
jgi:hypothetical protein